MFFQQEKSHYHIKEKKGKSTMIYSPSTFLKIRKACGNRSNNNPKR